MSDRSARRPGRVALAAMTCLTLAVVIAGCASQASQSPVATTTVDLPKSYKFAPALITVHAGATVTWTNDDNFTHSISFAGNQPQVMSPGQSATRSFPTPGTYVYVCSFHPQNMKGTVVVTDS